MILVLPDTLLGILLAISTITLIIYFILLIKNEYKKAKAIENMTVNCGCEVDVNEFAKELKEKLDEMESIEKMM